MHVSTAQYRAQKKYDSAHTRQFQMKLRLVDDAVIISRPDQHPSKQGAVRKLIAVRSMEKGGNENAPDPRILNRQ